MVKITVFMAVYNGATYIKESIDSVLNQTLVDFELLIIDDGSTDNSVDIINTYSDKRIRLLQNEKNEGLVYTRKRSVVEARGEYLAILDCDDIAMPKRLELQYNYLEKNSEIALCGGHTQYINGKGEYLSILKMPLHNLPIEMLFLNVFINSALMIRIEAIKSVGGYENYRCAGDFDLSLRIANKYKVANLDEILVKYRLHDNNMSTSQNDLMVREEYNIINDMHIRLGLNHDAHRVSVHHALYVLDYEKYKLTDYMYLFETLKAANNKCEKYEKHIFNTYIYDKWYNLLRMSGDRNVFLSFLRSELLYLPAVKFKHIRKVFKQSLGIRS